MRLRLPALSLSRRCERGRRAKRKSFGIAIRSPPQRGVFLAGVEGGATFALNLRDHTNPGVAVKNCEPGASKHPKTAQHQQNGDDRQGVAGAVRGLLFHNRDRTVDFLERIVAGRESPLLHDDRVGPRRRIDARLGGQDRVSAHNLGGGVAVDESGDRAGEFRPDALPLVDGIFARSDSQLGVPNCQRRILEGKCVVGIGKLRPVVSIKSRSESALADGDGVGANRGVGGRGGRQVGCSVE